MIMKLIKIIKSQNLKKTLWIGTENNDLGIKEYIYQHLQPTLLLFYFSLIVI